MDDEYNTGIPNLIYNGCLAKEYDQELTRITWPHCDHRVLHEPGECSTCDEHASALQYIRKYWKINFTGHFNPEKLPCPADLARGAGSEYWSGNRPDGVNPEQRREDNQDRFNNLEIDNDTNS